MTNIAAYGILLILSPIIIFHFCILLKIVPYHMVWGGRLKTDQEMVRFETVSILVNLFFLAIILIQMKILPINLSSFTLRIIFWIMAALFLLNTVGNLLSKNKFEKMFFTPITLLLAIFSIILAL